MTSTDVNEYGYVTRTLERDEEDDGVTLDIGFGDLDKYKTWENDAKWDTEIDGKIRLIEKKQYTALIEPDGLLPVSERKGYKRYKTKITRFNEPEEKQLDDE